MQSSRAQDRLGARGVAGVNCELNSRRLKNVIADSIDTV